MSIGLIVGLLLFTLLAAGSFGAYPQRRFGIRQDAILTANNQMENKNAIYSYVFELYLAKNPRLDTGLSFGYGGLSSNTTTYNANYDMIQAGLGLRYYFDERAETAKTFHVFQRYASLDGNLYLSSRYQTITATSPSSLFGFGAKAGLGAEYVFGPHSNGFLEGSCLLTDIKSTDSAYSLPLSGFILAFGIRLSP